MVKIYNEKEFNDEYREEANESKQYARLQKRFAKFSDYSISEIESAIESLDDKHKKVYMYMNPLDGSIAMPFSYISSKTNLSFKEIYRYNIEAKEMITSYLESNKAKSKINTLRKKCETYKSKVDVKEKSDSSLDCKKYNQSFVTWDKMFPKVSIEEIKHALTVLSNKERKIFLWLHPLEGNAYTIEYLMKRLEINKSTIEHIEYDATKKIRAEIARTRKISTGLNTQELLEESQRKARIEDIKATFGVDDLEIINQILEKVNERDKNIFLKRYPLDGSKPLPHSKIAKMNGLKDNQSVVRVQKIKDFILKNLSTNLSEDLLSDRESAFLEDDCFDLTKEEIEDAIKNLSPMTREVFSYKYPFGGGIPLTPAEISIKMGITKRQVYNSLKSTKNAISLYKKIKAGIKNDRRRNRSLGEIFREYTQEEINSALFMLEPTEREFISYRYPQDKSKFLTIEEISSILKLSENGIGIMRRRILAKMQIILSNMNNNEEETVSKEYNSNIKNLIGLLKNEKQETVLLLRLGFCTNGKCLTEEQIAIFLKTTLNDVKSTITSAREAFERINGIRLQINNDKEESKHI